MRSETTPRLGRAVKAVTCGFAVTVAALLASPHAAVADPAEELQAVQQQIQQGNQDYEEATKRVEELQGQIDENQERIDEIEGKLPEQRELAENSVRTLYKMQQGSGGLVELLLGADDFYDLLSTIQYLDVIQAKNTDALNELVAMENELTQARIALDAQQQEAEEEEQRAEDALAEAEEARGELEAKIAAQAAAEEAQRRAALEAAQRALEEAQKAAAEAEQKAAETEGSQTETTVENPTFTTESGSEAPVEVPESPDAGNVDWSSDKQAFVSEWSARIDAYLAGSPLAGQGATFAEAAWEFGVDPRFSPAISTVESSTGRVCFRPHNAWGWGSSSWGSWEEAIWAHVAGLASGYGGQLTYAGAQKYCPPNADVWYASVLANMLSI